MRLMIHPAVCDMDDVTGQRGRKKIDARPVALEEQCKAQEQSPAPWKNARPPGWLPGPPLATPQEAPIFPTGKNHHGTQAAPRSCFILSPEPSRHKTAAPA